MIKVGQVYKYHEQDSRGNILLFRVDTIDNKDIAHGTYISNWKSVVTGMDDYYSEKSLTGSQIWTLHKEIFKPNTKPEWL